MSFELISSSLVCQHIISQDSLELFFFFFYCKDYNFCNIQNVVTFLPFKNELFISKPTVTSVSLGERWITQAQRKRTAMCTRIHTNKYIKRLNQQQ